MRGLNKVMVVGYVGADPELRESADGKPWCALSVATKRSRRRGEEWVEETDWHDVRVFGADAHHCERMLGKGSVVAVEGVLTYETWTDDSGRRRRKARVVASKVQFITLRTPGAEPAGPTLPAVHAA